MKSFPQSRIHPENRGDFHTTHWSLVLQAGSSGPEKQAAMQQLCSAYYYPLYAYVRRRGHKVEDAQDLTQSFFAQLLEKEWLHRVEDDGPFSSLQRKANS